MVSEGENIPNDSAYQTIQSLYWKIRGSSFWKVEDQRNRCRFPYLNKAIFQPTKVILVQGLIIRKESGWFPLLLQLFPDKNLSNSGNIETLL